MFKTRITEMLGIKYPIIQGAMLWLANSELAAAVSNAGGLGILSSANYGTAEDFREGIKKTQSLTANPFAVNITLLPTFRPVHHEKYLAIAIEAGVSIIETSGRNPQPYIKMLKDAGATTMHKCARVKDALTAERLGVDAVTIVGFEAGGNPGMEEITSLVQIPLAAAAVKIPVIAGGGIADGKGLTAALALGADGVMLGTRFLASQECTAHPRIKEWLIQATEKDTIMINRTFNNPERVLRTELSLNVLRMEEKGATLEDLLPTITGLRGKQALEEGNINKGVISAGETVGLIHNIPSVREIIDTMVEEAEATVKRLESAIIIS